LVEKHFFGKLRDCDDCICDGTTLLDGADLQDKEAIYVDGINEIPLPLIIKQGWLAGIGMYEAAVLTTFGGAESFEDSSLAQANTKLIRFSKGCVRHRSIS